MPWLLAPSPQAGPPFTPHQNPPPQAERWSAPCGRSKKGGPCWGEGASSPGLRRACHRPACPPSGPPAPPAGGWRAGHASLVGKKERSAGLFLPSPTTRKGPESLKGFRPFSCPVCWRARPFLCCLACPSVRSGLGGPPGLRAARYPPRAALRPLRCLAALQRWGTGAPVMRRTLCPVGRPSRRSTRGPSRCSRSRGRIGPAPTEKPPLGGGGCHKKGGPGTEDSPIIAQKRRKSKHPFASGEIILELLLLIRYTGSR